MKTKNILYFCGGAIAGIVVASTLFFFVHYARGLPGITFRSRGTPPRWQTLQRTTYFLGSTKRLHLSQQRSHEFKRKSTRLFLPVVITSQNQSADTFKAVQKTWGQIATDWTVAIGDISRLDLSWLEKDYQNFDHILVADRCQDFSSNGSLSSENMFCLLNAIYRANSADYDWFVIVPSSTYIAVSRLKNVLAKLDPGVLFYIGKPSTSCGTGLTQFFYNSCVSYCGMQHGLILSHAALRQLVPQLSWCLLEGTKFGDKEKKERNGDIALGFCIKKVLFATCSDSLIESLVDPSALFLSYSSHSWLQGDFIGVSNVPTYKDMLALHVHMMSIDMWAYLSKLKGYAQLVHQTCLQQQDTSACNVTAAIPKPLLFQGVLSSSVLPDQSDSGRSTRDLLRWEMMSLTDNKTYISENIDPFRTLSDNDIQKLKLAVMKSLEYLKKSVLGSSLVELQDAYLRYSGHRGQEFIVDLKMEGKEKVLVWRSYLAFPPSSGLVYVEAANTELMDRKIVEFIVPLSNVNNRLVKFLKMYVGLCLVNEGPCSLNLVVYGKNDADQVRDYFSTLMKIYPEADLNLIEGNGTFNRGRALNLGVSRLQDNDLLFFCDVDMIVKGDFIRRCQRNTIQGRQAYYPEFFKYYDMDYVYKFGRKPAGYLEIDRRHGHWATYSFGMACLYKSDYIAAGGFDISIEGWGGEDTAFAQTLLRNKLELFRVPDPALSHEFHDKVCSVHLKAKQFADCLSSRKEGIADKKELAGYLFHLEEKCGSDNWGLWGW